MKISRAIQASIVAVFLPGCVLLSCMSPNSGGTESGDAMVAGVLYNSNGFRAAHATVKVTRWNRSPRDNDVIYAMTSTDENGVYRFDSLPSDTYNILGSGDGGLSYLDSVVVNAGNSSLQVPSDTLKAAGGISGRIKLAAGDDPRTVLILVMGTNTWDTPDDSSGNFTVSNLAEGIYRIRFLATLDDYLPKDTVISVTAGRENLLSDPITLAYSRLLPPANLTAFFDTTHGCTVLKWNRVDAPDLAGYVVYRNDTASSIPQRLNNYPVTDTFYVDTVFFDLMDTANAVFTYRIKAQDNEANLSARYSKPCTVGAPSPTSIRTFITYRFMNTINDSASINDTVSVIASYVNATRKNIQVQWFIDSKNSLKRTCVVSAFTGSDTLRIAWPDSSKHRIYSAITDEANVVWWDSTAVRIVPDAPIASAGNDTVLMINGTLLLHGSATQEFGTIVKWEWKLDSGVWNTTGGSDTVFTDPSTKDIYVCSLAVTDDDGNRSVDEIKIYAVKNVVSAAAGSACSFFLKADSTLWACGSNFHGQLGIGTTTTSGGATPPTKVMTNVKNMDVGVGTWGSYAHSLILRTDGSLWGCGYNIHGQYGNGTMSSSTPVQVMTNVKSMAAGEGSHSLILKNDSTLWACGDNSYGQLGSKTLTDRSAPAQVMTDVQSMDAGYYYSLILKTDATLWACGKNDCGQLGDGTTNNQDSPIQVMTDAKSISAGFSHSLILKTDGTLWACGSNGYGQLGDGTTNNRSAPVQVMTNVKSVSAGFSHSLILKTDGTLWACGSNGYGQLGDGTTDSRYLPFQVMTDVESMSAGGGRTNSSEEGFSLIIKTDGTVLACGSNTYGQFGDGTTRSSLTPMIVILPVK